MTTETILQEAQRLVYGDRGNTYGHPLDNYSRTAVMWGAILGVPVAAEQVMLCMIAVKIGRELQKHSRDNLTDICGYADCDQQIHERRQQIEQEVDDNS
jgi:hypothetical protein